MFGKFHKGFLESYHMFGSPTINEPIIASMCNNSCEGINNNIFFFTRRIFTCFFGFLSGRFIILYSVSMMSFLSSLLIVRDIFVNRTFSSIVSFLVTCIASDSRQIFIRSSNITFLVRKLTFVIFCSTTIEVYYESLIFTSHLFFSSFYSSFFL